MRGPGRKLRRGILVVALLLLCSVVALADRTVPVELQVRLMAKGAAYDRNMPKRVRGGAHLVVIHRNGDVEGSRLARRMRTALAKESKFADSKPTVELYSYEGAAAMAEMIGKRKVAIAYFAGSFDGDAKEIRRALEGMSVLTVSSNLDAVKGGIVLGIGLSSGRPKLYLNLPQARKQKVQLAPRLIKLMEVYR